MIWVVPAPTAVTTPVFLSTVATEVLLESQVQVLISASAGVTEAVRVAVWPTSRLMVRSPSMVIPFTWPSFAAYSAALA